MRLVEGSTHREGRVEVCADGCWGTISINSHGIAGPGDICNKLGFPAEGAVVSPRPEAVSARTIARRGFVCSSDPKSYCDRSESPGLEVRCLSHEDVVSKDSFCAGNQEGHFRLVNGSSPNEGKVEVCINGGWRSVCAKEKNSSALTESICLALGFSEEDPMLKINESGNGEALCCSTYKHKKILCEQCSCNHTIRVECQACLQSVQQVTTSMYPQSEWLPPVTMNNEESSQFLDCTSATPIGVVSGVLVTLLVATVVGWTVTCVVWRRSVTLKRRKFLNVPDPCTAVCRSDQSHPIQLLDDDMYSVPTLPTPASINYTSVDPNYDMITRERLDTYEAIDHNEHNSNPQHVQVVNPTPVRDEASKKEDDFYDAEEHTYAVVNKKKTKKTSEDGEGEREEPPDYEMAVPGETSWGVMNEENS